MHFFQNRPKTLDELWSEYQRHNLRIQKPRTVANYERVIRRFGDVLDKTAIPLAALTDENCSALVRALIHEGKSAPTANNYAKCLKALWTFANIRGYVNTRPSLRKLAEPQPDTSTWNKRELAALFRCCSMQQGWIGPIKASDWWLTLHMISYDTAERTGALLAIELSWIDRDESLLRIPAEFRKGGTKRGSYRLRPCTMAQIDQIWHPERRLLFEGMALVTFHRSYNALLSLAGLPTGRRNGLQRMRRTVATLYEKAGGDATRFLQHTDRRVTEWSYLDEARLDIPGPVELLPPVEW